MGRHVRRSWGIPVGLTALLLEAKTEVFHSMMRYAPIDTRSRQNATSHHPGTVNTDPRTILKRPCGRIVGALEGIGHRVVTAAGDIHSNATAGAVARQLSGTRPDPPNVNVPVWAFPHFIGTATQEPYRSAQHGATFHPHNTGTLVERDSDGVRRAIRSLTAAAPADPACHPAQDVDVRALIEALPARLRSAFLLHYYAGFAVREVAVMLGRPEGTVKADLYHARARLKAALGDSDG